MPRYRNPIAPFERTPKGIRAFQKNQPFPDNPTPEQKKVENHIVLVNNKVFGV